ncbi:MAG: hypothetical protein ACOYMK_17410, partial [Hyphomonadaceae bacterium]
RSGARARPGGYRAELRDRPDADARNKGAQQAFEQLAIDRICPFALQHTGCAGIRGSDGNT